MSTNTSVIFASYPSGIPVPENFRIEESPLPQLTSDGLLLKLRYISVDPYMRGRMRQGLKSYIAPFAPGEPLNGGCVAEVAEVKNVSDYAVGDLIVGFLPWQRFVVVPKGQQEAFQLTKLPTFEGVPISTGIGALGMPGMTAYFGLLDITNPKPGETVVVSAAAGAVGSLVGQIAKVKGCRVIGIAGSDEKVKLLTEKYGFDSAINYKTNNDFTKMLKALTEACPNGIDIYFDNTGGYISDAAITLANNFARFSICGAISSYNTQDLLAETGPRTDFFLVAKQIKKEGFLVSRWKKQFPEGIKQMAEWIKAGKIKFDETVVEGIENTPKAFIGMLQGENVGKMIVKV